MSSSVSPSGPCGTAARGRGALGSRAWNLPLRALRDRSGLVAVEWAFAALSFVALLLGTMEMGRYFFMAQSLRSLVGEVTRAAIVDTTLGDGAEDCASPKTRFASRTPMIDTSDLTICVQRSRVGTMVTIDVRGSIPYTFASPALSGRIVTLSETTRYSYPGS